MSKNRSKKTKSENPMPTHNDGWYRNDVGEDNNMAFYHDGKIIIEFPLALYNRCRYSVGMSDAMIASYDSAEALKQAADGMHGKSNPDARVKEGKLPEQKKFEDNMPDSFTLESILEAKFMKTNRDHYDRGVLQAYLRRINRKYGPKSPVRIVQDRSFVVVKRELVTKYTIYFK